MKFSMELAENPKDSAAVFRVVVEDKGISTVKNLNVQDAVKLLTGSVYESKTKLIRLGQLPYGYVDSYVTSKQDTFRVALLYPPKKRGIKYFGRSYYVPYPATLYIFEVKNGYVQQKNCFAVKDNAVSSNTVLYRFPFGNVSGTGSMCFGNIKLPKVKCLKDIDNVIELFLCGDVNDDLWHGNISRFKKQFELLEYLEGRKTFPRNLLVECRTLHNTFADAFS